MSATAITRTAAGALHVRRRHASRGGVSGAPGHNARARSSATFAAGGCGGWREERRRAGGKRRFERPAAAAAGPGADRGHHRVPQALRYEGLSDPYHQRPRPVCRRSHQSSLPQQNQLIAAAYRHFNSELVAACRRRWSVPRIRPGTHARLPRGVLLSANLDQDVLTVWVGVSGDCTATRA